MDIPSSDEGFLIQKRRRIIVLQRVEKETTGVPSVILGNQSGWRTTNDSDADGHLPTRNRPRDPFPGKTRPLIELRSGRNTVRVCLGQCLLLFSPFLASWQIGAKPASRYPQARLSANRQQLHPRYHNYGLLFIPSG